MYYIFNAYKSSTKVLTSISSHEDFSFKNKEILITLSKRKMFIKKVHVNQLCFIYISKWEEKGK